VVFFLLCAALMASRLKGQPANDSSMNSSARAELLATMGQLKELLADVPCLCIKTVGSKIVFDGKIKSLGDMEKIKKVMAAYPGAVIDLSAFDPAGMSDALKTAVLKDLREAGLESVAVEVNGDVVVLQGIVASDGELTNAVETAKLRTPNVKSFLRVQEVMIETDLQFVQVDQETGSSVGQNLFDNNVILTPSFAAANSGRPGLNLGATATYKINTVLNASNCKIVYQEHISGASGQEVDFKQGGTLYVPPLAPVPYGVIVKIKPTLLGNGGILSDVTVEVSTAATFQGQVTTREFKTSTAVMSRIGDTVVLSGFAEALGTSSSDKAPILGDIPLLNLLFGSKSKSKSHKDAILLLTPRPSSVPQQATGPAFSAAAKKLLDEVPPK
jgi:Flp pilus assembly secretin CpaC